MASNTTEDALASEALDWLIALSEAPGDDALRARFEAWRCRSGAHASAWREASLVDGLIGASRNLVAMPGRDTLVAARPAPRRHSLRHASIWAAFAAACLVLALLPALDRRMRADHVTGTGEQREIALGEGSSVALGPDSAIAIDLSAGQRKVTLIGGEAFFQVSPDPARPFVVIAGEVKATVLGTAFDVRRTASGAVVSVREGMVGVEGAAASTRLGAGEWASIADGTLAGRGHVAPQLVAAWRYGQIAVKDQTVADSIDILRRTYGGLIVLRGDGLAGQRITGLYDLSNPGEALTAMVAPHGGRVTRLTPWVLVVGD